MGASNPAKPPAKSSVGTLRIERLGVDLQGVSAEFLARLFARAELFDERLAIGRYLLLGELGRGGMGVVYEAWDPRIARRVALKTIAPDLILDEAEREETIERFRREIRVIGGLRHPSIVTIFDDGEEAADAPFDRAGRAAGRLLYYVMEFLEGRSLSHVLREKRTMADLDAVKIALDVARALVVIHGVGVIHRDIKPSNVFIRDGQCAVVIDFGIAKADSHALTKRNQILGTPRYLAPERLREKEEGLDGRADVFSLGALLYSMLKGETPFRGNSVPDLLENIQRQAHSRLERDTPGGRNLAAAIDRMLAKRPEDRFQTAADVVRALEDVLGDLSRNSPGEKDTDPSVRSVVPVPSVPLADASRRVPGPSPELPVALPSKANATRPQPGDPLDTLPEAALGRDTRRLVRNAPGAAVARELHPEQMPKRAQPDVAVDGDEDATRAEDATRTDEATGVDEATHSEDETMTELAPHPRALDRPDERGLSGAKNSRFGLPPSQKPSPAEAAPAPPRGASSSRPRIEASLMDEADAVVRPVDLKTEAAEDLPTLGDALVAKPVDVARSRPQDVVATDLLPRRRPPATRDPAERPRIKEDPSRVARLRGTSRSRGLSAMIARRTFAARPNAAPFRDERAAPRLEVDDRQLFERDGRRRMIRRRLVLLLLGVLAAGATGLLLGRMRHRSVAVGATDTPVAKEAAVPDGIEGVPSLVSPRTPLEILEDGEARLREGRLIEAEQLFRHVVESADPASQLSGLARVGQAEVLLARKDHEAARAMLEAIIDTRPSSGEAAKAKTILATIDSVSASRTATNAAAATKSPPAAGRSDARSKRERARGTPEPSSGQQSALVSEENDEDTRGRAADPTTSPVDAHCRALMLKHIGDPSAGVAAFLALRTERPDAACVHSQLAKFYERMNNTQLAAQAWRRYLELAPQAPDRAAIQQRISSYGK